MSYNIRKATKADFPVLKRVLARAFDADPLVNWLIRQDKRRDARIEQFFALSLQRFAGPHDLIYTTSALTGAAVWIPPGKWQGNWLHSLLILPALARITGLRQLPQKARAIQAVDRLHPATAHYYLITLGVDPARQRQGIGSALLLPALNRCDAEQTPAYLETATEQNLPFYIRHGFRVRDVLQVKPDGPTLWTMWREPL